MQIASIDPGTTSGVVLWEGEYKRHMGGKVVDGLRGMYEIHGQERVSGEWMGSSKSIAGILMGMNDGYGPDVLLIEDFILTGGKGHSSEREGLDPVRVTCGVLTLLDSLEWNGDVLYYQPSIASVFHDIRMKKWGLYMQGRNVRYSLTGAGTGYGGHGRSRVGRDWACDGFEGHATSAARGLVWFLREKI